MWPCLDHASVPAKAKGKGVHAMIAKSLIVDMKICLPRQGGRHACGKYVSQGKEGGMHAGVMIIACWWEQPTIAGPGCAGLSK
eukprot:scaffold23987_cov22-Tisochrysis_lutea.AAC.3